MANQSVLTYTLLALIIVVWAVAWPISKIGLTDMPPMWFSAFRLWIGFFAIFIILLFQKKIKLPRRRDMPMILSIGLVQMACFLILLNGGLLYVDAGRSAMLVYSTPFFVTPIAVLFLGEKLTIQKLIGLVLGFIGVLLLFSPWSFDWSDHHVVIGNVLLLLAAICWAITMIHTRYGTWHSPSIQLVPWQLLIASVFVLLVSLVLNPHPRVSWTPSLWLTILYNGLLSTGFGYTASIFVSQRLPVINTSLFMLAVPVLGLLISAWWLGETITPTIISALLLIIGGLAVMTTNKR